jgi:four helix bundle protein
LLNFNFLELIILISAMHICYFEKPEVWKLSIELTKKIYKITSEYSSDEKYGLVSQMRRASVSISSNLAEGSARNTRKDQADFTTISYLSLIELLNLIILSKEFDFINEAIYSSIRKNIE